MRFDSGLPGAVIFDMDGLMLDTEPIYRAAWQQAAARVGHEISDALYATFVGRRVPDCEALLLQKFGVAFPMVEFQNHAREVCSALMENGIPYKPGLQQLLEFLEERRVPRAVATSTARGTALRCLGDLAPRFHALATGEEVANGKPAPDIFLLAAQRLNIEPSRCLVLEDSVSGTQAGLAAGMRVIVVPDLVEPAPQASHICQSLQEVRFLLEKAARAD